MANFDVAVVGGGPGGYVAAIRAAQLGQRVALFERERVGGLCVNWGCIPSKTLLHFADVVNYVREAERFGITVENVRFDLGVAIDESRAVVDRLVRGVEGLLTNLGVETVSAEARFTGPTTLEAGGQSYEAAHTIIATGAETRALRDISFDGDRIITSREALEMKTPPQRAVVVGAGPVGVEFAHLWSSYGTEVTIVEMLDRVMPGEDTAVSRDLARAFDKRGIKVMTGAKVTAAESSGEGIALSIETSDGAQQLDADVALVAVGFIPHTSSLNVEAAGVALDERGFIGIDERMRTNVDNIYAIGDVTGKLMLAHVAMQQGSIAAEQIAGHETPVLDYVQMPRATFCQPQVGSVGYTEDGAREAGFEVRTGRFPLTALGRTVATGQTEGFVKVVVDDSTDQVIGIHILASEATTLVGEASLAALLETTTRELGFAVAAHPTLAEALKEAALAADGEAIHITQRRRQEGSTRA